MSSLEPNITINADLTNPGQFFACCGLFELADRRWPGTQAWFDDDSHTFAMGQPDFPVGDAASQLIDLISKAQITNTMTAKQVSRRNEIGNMTKRERSAANVDDEKKELDKLWREAPILIGAPFHLRIDWFLDDYSGGGSFKTWAGQQSVIDILLAMKSPIETDWAESETTPEDILNYSIDGGGVPFNFDSVLGQQGSGLDIGFSLDALRISIVTRPILEFLAFVGLQRFRPQILKSRNSYRYSAWQKPVDIKIAAAVCCGAVEVKSTNQFQFSLLYRTKYLKSFLPAKPIGEMT